MSGIYIHIPFCNRRCSYCDFYLITNLNVKDKYLDSLKKEITLYASHYGNIKFNTIFFGGGTPSVLSHKKFEEIINLLYDNFDLSKDSEISMEANPEDFREKNLNDYGKAGINRISFGVQSFIDHELKFLTRQHTASEAELIIKKAGESFDNINLDIIYSLPSQTLKDIEFSLSKAVELKVNHISAYTLTYEERTPLYKSLQKNLLVKNTENDEGDFYNFVSGKLRSEGYVHYEVSNFAKEGYQCIHNLKYWEYDGYIGFGPSSHSMIDGVRWNNFRDIIRYNNMLSEGILPVEEKSSLTSGQKKLEYIMLALRSRGVDFEKYYELFGNSFKTEYTCSVKELLKHGFAKNTERKFYLTDKGYSIADEIIAKYF